MISGTDNQTYKKKRARSLRMALLAMIHEAL